LRSRAVALCIVLGTAGASVGHGDVRAAESSAGSMPGVPDTVYVVPRIIVEAERPRSSDGSGFVARIDLGARRGRVDALPSVLSRLVGVRVTQYGGLGSFATASIRGSSSSHVKVYLDGVPVDDAYLGVVDLSQLPLGGVDRVDVYRGTSPVELGAPAIGGAVNLVTWGEGRLERATIARAEVHESYGSFDTSRHQASVWSHPRGLRLFLHGGYSKSLGDFDFLDDNGTAVNPGDDAVAARANNDFDILSVTVRAEADLPALGTVAAGLDAVRGARGVPGLGSYQSASARSERWQRAVHARIRPAALLSGRLTTSATAFHSRSTDVFTDRDATLSLRASDTENSFRSFGGRARARWLAPALPVVLEAALDATTERFQPREHLPEERVGPERWRRSTTGAANAELYLFDQSLVVSFTGRVEHQANEFYDAAPAIGLPESPRGRYSETYTNPAAGLRWRATRHVTLKANAGRYHRLPTFLELFGNVGAVTGNAALEPERGVNRDVGAVVAVDKLGPLSGVFLEAVALYNEVDALILYFPNSQRTSRPVNIGAAAIRGAELSAAAEAGRAFSIALNYTFLDTEDTGDIPYYSGNRLPSRPRHLLNAALTCRRRDWQLCYELHHLGSNYLDRANTELALRRTMHDLILDRRLGAGFSVTLEGRNLTDERVSDVGGFPLPGRLFYTTLGYRYSAKG
jgi:iron complex outermembrane receptor protein